MNVIWGALGLNVIGGVLLFIAGLLGFVWPEKSIRYWYLGMLSEDTITKSGRTFFRVLGSVCALAALGIAILG